MMHLMIRGIVLALAAAAVAAPARGVEIQAGELRLTLDSATGKLLALDAGAARVPLRATEAIFQVRDVKARSTFVPLTGPLRRSGAEYVMEASSRTLGLRARIRFHVLGTMLAYRADITDTRREERGLVVSMTLPLQPSGLVWSGDLYSSETARPGTLYGNNVIPISASSAGNGTWAIAAAIPPSAPAMYDTHLKDGNFGLNYYAGISWAPRELPGRTWIAGLIYAVDPQWSFRSALEKYYQAYPDFYTRRVSRTGAWCTRINATKETLAAGCGFYEVGGGEWNKTGSRMRTNTAKSPEDWVRLNDVAAAHDLGVLLFPYTIVGQRQIFVLPGDDLYTDYNRAMAAFETWTTDQEFPFQNPANANSFNSVAHLKEMIRNSGMQQKDGLWVTEARRYTGNTLTFPLNPNPRLFSDDSRQTIAKYTLEDYVPKLLKAAPEIDGFYVDSMGHWNDFTNYRRDHFAYAKYPLAVDQEGDPVLRNLSSHYEYVEEFRKRMHAMRKFVFLNGVNGGGGTRDGVTDHAGSRATSRFFLAALADFCGIESGVRTSAERMGHYRVMSGRKPYAIMAYGNKPGEDELFRDYLRRATAFGIFPSVGSHVYSTPALQPLSMKLHELYLPLLQKLNEAGWEPVAGVRGVVAGVVCERFGRADNGSLYLTLFNDGNSAADLVLSLDTMLFGAGKTAIDLIDERQLALDIHNGTLKLRLDPAQLRVLQVR